MKIVCISLLSIIFLLSSCTGFKTKDLKRSLANNNDSPLELEEILIFKKSKNDHPKQFIQDMDYYLKSILKDSDIEVSLIEDSTMKETDSFRLVPVINKEKYLIAIYHSPEAVYDRLALNEVERFLEKLKSSYSSPYSLFELYYNAKKGDFSGYIGLEKLRFAAIKRKEWEKRDYVSQETIEFWNSAHEKFIEKENEIEERQLQITISKKMEDVNKEILRNTELKKFIANNDRKGTVNIIRNILQWNEMSSLEKEFWENSLEAMANPVPLEERILVYKTSSNEDYFPGTIDKNKKILDEVKKELKKEKSPVVYDTTNDDSYLPGIKKAKPETETLLDKAIKHQNIYILSSVVNALSNDEVDDNNVRVGLLPPFQKTSGTINENEFDKYTPVSNLLDKRSDKYVPTYSPFIEVTSKLTYNPNPEQGHEAVYLLDPRLVRKQKITYFQSNKIIQSKNDFLVPLLIFPEDLGGVNVSKVEGDNFSVNDFLRKMVLNKIETELGRNKAESVHEKIIKNSRNFFKEEASPKISIDKRYISIYKQVLPELENSQPLKKSSSELSCAELMKLFIYSN